jgi:hypothetical protein
MHTLFDSIVTRAISYRPQLKSLLHTEFGNMAALHVSLSRPLVLWTREKEEFLGEFTDTIRGLQYQYAYILLILDFRLLSSRLRMQSALSITNQLASFSF